jgi:hypothetical protein
MQASENTYFDRIKSEDPHKVYQGQKDFDLQGVYINDEKKFLLYWNPKASCTSLAYWYVSNRLNRDITDEVFRTYRYREGFYYSCNAIPDPGKYADYDRILFIRNPFKRIVSLYFNKFVFYPEKGWLLSYQSLEKFAQRVIGEVYSADGRDPECDYTGITFNRLLSWIMSKHQSAELNRDLNFHFTSQIKRRHLSLEMVKDFKFVFKTDHQDQHIATLNREYGFNLVASRMNNSGLKNSGKNFDLCDMSPGQIALHQDLSYNDFLNSDNMEVIYNLYLEDLYAYVAFAK